MSRKQVEVKKPKKKLSKVSTPISLRSLSAIGNPYPAFTNLEFHYCDRITIDAGGSGATALYQFSCNGMYDPDTTGTGHQPLGFDQWLGTSSTTGLYNHYVVYKSSIEVTACSQAADGTGQFVILLGISDDTTVSLDFNALMENPTYIHAVGGSIGSGKDIVRLRHAFDAAKVFGLTTDSLFSASQLQGNSSSNPSEQAHYSILASSNNVTVNPANIAFVVEIRYWARLLERKELLAS